MKSFKLSVPDSATVPSFAHFGQCSTTPIEGRCSRTFCTPNSWAKQLLPSVQGINQAIPTWSDGLVCHLTPKAPVSWTEQLLNTTYCRRASFTTTSLLKSLEHCWRSLQPRYLSVFAFFEQTRSCEAYQENSRMVGTGREPWKIESYPPARNKARQVLNASREGNNESCPIMRAVQYPAWHLRGKGTGRGVELDAIHHFIMRCTGFTPLKVWDLLLEGKFPNYSELGSKMKLFFTKQAKQKR